MTRLTGHEPFEELLTIVKANEEVYLSASAMCAILSAIGGRNWDLRIIQQLAEALENESVDYEDAKSGMIAQALFELSSPEINGAPTRERCAELVATLESPDSPRSTPGG